MTIIEYDNDNGLQDWLIEHQAVTGGIFYCRDSAGFSVSASNKLFPMNRDRLCNLTLLRFTTEGQTGKFLDSPRRRQQKLTGKPIKK